ncbi:amidohydrolase [Thioclava sp. BHET1]|nr:amidohydrolase [Thioclava sp. BHET1]
MLTSSDIAELTALRRDLHRRPDLSGREAATAEVILAALRALSPNLVLTGLGGHGLAALFDSGTPGPTVLFRAELDGLPIPERSDNAWRSQIDGAGHLCGHDGHMAMLLGLGRVLSRKPPATGRVALLFQPAEEIGTGARAVVDDPAFARIAPDFAFAIHNLPGLPLGHVATRTGLMNCASMGLAIHLEGKTAHAAMPQDGVSPGPAVAALINALPALGPGGVLDDRFRLATLTHAQLGAPTFGVAPGAGLVHVTLRAARDAALADLEVQARALAAREAERFGLQLRIETCDPFAASINAAEAVEIARSALDHLKIPHSETGLPMYASEDFGLFGRDAVSAMLCLGAGETQPALHNPDYDFPDALIPVGVAIFAQIARDILG